MLVYSIFSKQSRVTVVTKSTSTVITLILHYQEYSYMARIQPGRFRAFQRLSYKLQRPNRPRRLHIIYTGKDTDERKKCIAGDVQDKRYRQRIYWRKKS